MLRSLDPDMWAKFRARAAFERRGMKAVILALIGWYADYGLDKMQPKGAPLPPAPALPPRPVVVQNLGEKHGQP